MSTVAEDTRVQELIARLHAKKMQVEAAYRAGTADEDALQRATDKYLAAVHKLTRRECVCPHCDGH